MLLKISSSIVVNLVIQVETCFISSK